jgi:hypothetical protein
MRSIALPQVRRTVLRLVVGSFSLAALMGVAALVAPGRFGGLQGRVLLTTMVVGGASVLALCYLSVGSDPHRWVGALGGAAALVAVGALMLIIWAYWDEDPGRVVLRTFGVSGIVALTLAQFSLLLATVRRRPGLARLLMATLVLGTTLAGLLVVAVLGWEAGEAGARLIGVVAILDVLGTVVTIAIGVFGREERSLTVTLPPEVAARVQAESDATGRPVREVVDEALARYFDVSVD